jgi:hypothetical protein
MQIRKNKTVTLPCPECAGAGKVTRTRERLTRRQASRDWQNQLRRAARIDLGELRRLTEQHREARLFGACRKTRVGEMGAYAALASYIDKHGGEHALFVALAKRAS